MDWYNLSRESHCIYGLSNIFRIQYERSRYWSQCFVCDRPVVYFVCDRPVVYFVCGGLAQMVERSLSMREVAGSMPASSKLFIFLHTFLELYDVNIIVYNVDNYSTNKTTTKKLYIYFLKRVSLLNLNMHCFRCPLVWRMWVWNFY